MQAKRKCFLLLLATVLVLAGGCATEEPGIAPSREDFYFPTGIAFDPVRPLLYVTNANADLMYNGGTIMALDISSLPADLSRVGAEVQAGRLSCQPDPVDPTRWQCPEQQFVVAGATIRIGDFPAGLAVSRDGSRLFTPVRGQNYLLWADIVDIGGGLVDLRCSADREAGCGSVGAADCDVWDCDADHQVLFSEVLDRKLPAEPFGIYLNDLVAVHVDAGGERRTCLDGVSAVSCSCGPGDALCSGTEPRSCCIPEPDVDHVYIAHLSGGEVSLFLSEPSRVTLRDVRAGFFTTTTTIKGAFSIAPRTPGDAEGLSYVSSRVDSVLASFLIRGNSSIVEGPRAPIGAVVPGSDLRGLAFAPGGELLFAVSRLPPSLVALDMTLKEGAPRQEPIWAVEVCQEPSLLKLGPDPLAPAGSGKLLAYVVCFGSGEIFVVDTALGVVVGQIKTGKGPNELIIDGAARRGYVTNFLDNTIGVIDLDPSRTSYNKMLLRIGTARSLVRQ